MSTPLLIATRVGPNHSFFGPYDTADALETNFPASLNAGRRAFVGPADVTQCATYESMGGVWVMRGPGVAPSGTGTPGLSAYQVAQAQGYNGTVTQWLASLQGAQGAASTVPGPPGPASTVAGPPGAASTVAGPPGAASTIAGPPGAASTVAGPPGATGPAFAYSHAAPTAITVGASPFTYRNTLTQDADVIVLGGTVTLMSRSRDNATFYQLGLLVSGEVHLSPGDYLRVVYVVAPTMTLVPY